jgi:nucleotide-binding universal stress UspA family protein
MVIAGRHAARAVLETAAALPGGLIALASHGRARLARLLLGNTADQVVRGATVPVLLLRPNR